MDSTSEKDCSKFPFSALVPSGPISYTLQHHSRKTTISGCSASNKMKIQGRRNHRKRSLERKESDQEQGCHRVARNCVSSLQDCAVVLTLLSAIHYSLYFSHVQKYKTIKCSSRFSDTFPCFNIFLSFSAFETSSRLQNIKLHSKLQPL